jgi:transposase
MQGNRIMRFQEVYEAWQSRRLSQAEAAQILGVCERSFRRYIARYDEGDGDLNSLADRRLSQAFKRKAPDSEISAVLALYRSGFAGWNVKHFCAHYQHQMQTQAQPARSYSWVKTVLQGAGLVSKAQAKGKHHKKRDPKPSWLTCCVRSTSAWWATTTRCALKD